MVGLAGLTPHPISLCILRLRRFEGCAFALRSRNRGVFVASEALYVNGMCAIRQMGIGWGSPPVSPPAVNFESTSDLLRHLTEMGWSAVNNPL